MSAIPDRVWELLTEDERVRVKAITDGWRHEPRINCPSCGCAIGVRLSIKAGAVTVNPDGTYGTPATSVAQTVNVNEARLIAEAKESGMLDAFETAVKVARSSGGVPADMGAFFVTFLKDMASKKVPRFVIDRYTRDLMSDSLEFWSSQGVCAVVGDGIIRAFVPLSYLLGQPMYGIGSNPKRMGARPEQLDEWVRGRFGYVPAKSKTFMDEIRRKSIGDFCEFVQ